MILSLYFICETLKHRHQLRLLPLGNAHNGIRLARNGIAQITALDTGQTHTALGRGRCNETRSDLYRICASLVYIVTRMSAEHIGRIETVIQIFRRCLLAFTTQRRNGIHTAGTSDKDLSLVLRVEIDQILAADHALTQIEGSRKARLFIHRKQGLQRPVFRRGIEQQRQRRRHTYAAVGTQSRPLGTHPAILNTRANRIAVEIELHVAALLAHHIHV